MIKKMIILNQSQNPTIGKKEEKKKKMMMMRNMAHIHDEQRSVQMTISHRDAHTKTLLRQAL